MLIRSYLKEPDHTFINLSLKSHVRDEAYQTQNAFFQKKGFTIKSQLSFNSNICIVHLKIQNNQELTDIVDIKGEYIKIVYHKKGNLMVDGNQRNKKSNFPHFIICYGKNTVTQYEMLANSFTELSLIYITRSYFLHLMQKEEWCMKNTFFKKVIRDHIPESWEKSFPVNSTLCHVFKEITQFSCPCPIPKSCYFIGLKIREFFLVLHSFNQRRDSNALDIHPDLLKKINTVREFIEANFESTPTVKYLARYIFLNELQLKRGFKKVFGTTIRAYIIELKMKKALSLLHYYPGNEIANMLGYQSVSHFITTFKNFYGCTPSHMKKRGTL